MTFNDRFLQQLSIVASSVLHFQNNASKFKWEWNVTNFCPEEHKAREYIIKLGTIK